MGSNGMDGWGVLERASELARQGQAFALATVVWRQGPSSGQLGSRAIITADGEVHGWIGGACAEPVVIRQARQVIADGEPRLLLLGTPDQFGETVPEGMTVVPIACQSEGALEVFIEPVQPAPRIIVMGSVEPPAIPADPGAPAAPDPELPDPPDGLAVLPDSGFVVAREGPLWLAFRCGPSAPDYLPAHAHADALSFQLWWRGRPVVADPGTYTYEPGKDRDWFRSTRARTRCARSISCVERSQTAGWASTHGRA